ncbi:hypothetical protein AAMO2058_000932800 [Amorphochlora amoebiformis]
MSSGERKGSRGAGGHTVMILDQSVDEGHEFLIYAYQDSDDPAASRIILTRGEVVGMRGVTTMLEGGKFKIGTLQNDINASFKEPKPKKKILKNKKENIFRAHPTDTKELIDLGRG